MKCWICGDEATSREHMIKRSDAKSKFGSVHQQSHPLFFHTMNKRNQRIGSLDSDLLKFKKSLCAYCNNSRTSNHDRSWEKLSFFLRSAKPPIKKGDVIRLDKVFPGAVKRSMLDVHLYFLKAFGCAIVEYDIPLHIKSFSKAILENQPHPYIYIAFGPSDGMITGRTEIIPRIEDNACRYWNWFYIIEPIVVNIIYAEPGEDSLGLVRAWHPTTVTKCLHVGAF